MSTQQEAVSQAVRSGHDRMMAMFEAAEAFAEAMAPILVEELAHQTGIRGVSFDRALQEVEEILGGKMENAKESAMDLVSDAVGDDPDKYRMYG